MRVEPCRIYFLSFRCAGGEVTGLPSKASEVKEEGVRQGLPVWEPCPGFALSGVLILLHGYGEVH